MAIDPSIPLGVRGPQPFDAVGSLGNIIQLRGLQQRQQLQEQEMALKQREVTEKDQVRAILQESQGNLETALPKIRALNPLMAASIEKTMTEAQEAKLKLSNGRIKHDLDAAEFISRQLNGVTDQESYDYARAAIAGAGLPTEKMQPVFDPGYIESLKAKGLSIKDKLELEQKEIDRLFQERKFQAEQANVAADNERADRQVELQTSRDMEMMAERARDNARSDAHLGLARQTAARLAQQATSPQSRPLSQTAEANIINRLSNQWATASKSTKELDRAVSLMETGMTAAKRGDLAQGSQAVLVTFQKILDPTSVVRESEYARSASGLSLLDRMQGAVQTLAKGGAGVPLAELEKFANLAREMARSQKSTLSGTRKRLEATAQRYNIPTELVLEGDSGVTSPAPQPNVPAEGTERIINGKRAVWKTIGGQSGWVAK